MVQLGMHQQLIEQFHKSVQQNEAAAAAAVAQLTGVPQQMLGANMMGMGQLMGMGGMGVMERMGLGLQGMGAIDPAMMGAYMQQQNPMISSANSPTRPVPVKVDGFLAPNSPPGGDSDATRC